jgi:L-lactate utilization protein LutB
MRPIYLSGSTPDRWATNTAGDTIYYCYDHYIDASVLCAICEECGEDVPVTPQAIEIVLSRKNQFIARHKNLETARLALEFTETNVYGNLYRHCNDDFI